MGLTSGNQIKAVESYIVLDSVSGKVLLASQTEKKRPVASLTKVATAKLTLDWASLTKTDLSKSIVVPPSAANIQGANPTTLMPGDSLSIQDALYAALLGSDNIAAYTLADCVGYSLNKNRGITANNITSFVAEINRLAQALGMKNTRFINPHGLDSAQSYGVSTATDMALLSIAAMRNETIASIAKTTSRKIHIKRKTGKTEAYMLKNTNSLLGKDGVIGLKTGFTSASGQCLTTVVKKEPVITVTANEKISRPRQLIIVLLGSNDRFDRTQQLIAEGWKSYTLWGSQGYLVAPDGKDTLKLP